MPSRSTPDRVTRSRLPGIGERTELRTVEGDVVSLVEHTSGTTDLQVGDGPVARLSESDARALGASLAGTFSVDPSLLDDLGGVLGGLEIDDVCIDRDGPVAGRSIGEVEVRKRHRVTVVAVVQGSLADVAPGPETVLEAGARVVLIGRPDDVEEFVALVGGGRGA